MKQIKLINELKKRKRRKISKFLQLKDKFKKEGKIKYIYTENFLWHL